MLCIKHIHWLVRADFELYNNDVASHVIKQLIVMKHIQIKGYSYATILLLMLGLLYSCGESNDINDTQITEPDTSVDSVEPLDSYIIAHACNWTQFNNPMNSRAAFESALNLKVYGVEFDVNQTADGVFVIYHDISINNKNISSLNYSDLSDFHLSNGENIPTLDDFLSIYRSAKVNIKLVVELKRGNVSDLLKKINDYNLLNNVLLVSFNQNYCQEFVQTGYGKKVVYNISDESLAVSPLEIKRMGYMGVSYHFSLLDKHADWINEAKQNGIRVFVWTIDDSEKLNFYTRQEVIVTTNYPWKFSN